MEQELQSTSRQTHNIPVNDSQLIQRISALYNNILTAFPDSSARKHSTSQGTNTDSIQTEDKRSQTQGQDTPAPSPRPRGSPSVRFAENVVINADPVIYDAPDADMQSETHEHEDEVCHDAGPTDDDD